MNWTYLLLVALLLSCSHQYRTSIDISSAKIRDISASSLPEARSVISNYHRYLTELFRQSKDPYYNKNRWEEDCLNENLIGRVEESKNGPQLVSLLYLDEFFQPGTCSGERFHVIMVYCPELLKVREIKINLGNELKVIEEKALCK